MYIQQSDACSQWCRYRKLHNEYERPYTFNIQTFNIQSECSQWCRYRKLHNEYKRPYTFNKVMHVHSGVGTGSYTTSTTNLYKKDATYHRVLRFFAVSFFFPFVGSGCNCGFGCVAFFPAFFPAFFLALLRRCGLLSKKKKIFSHSLVFQ